MYKTGLFLLFLLFILKDSPGQDTYSPGPNNVLSKETHLKFKKKFTYLGAFEKFSNGNAKAQFSKMINEHWQSIYRMDTAGVFMSSDSLTKIIRNIFDKIIVANPELKEKEYLFLLYKNESLNAFSMGEGIIAFHLGFLPFVKTEDEIAFVLAHELAHDYKRHVVERMKKYCEMSNSKEFKAKVKSVKKSRYNKRNEVLGLLSSLNSAYLENSRENELEADSIAMVFLQKTGYSPLSGIEMMHLLDSSDHLFYQDTLDLKKYFHFENYPFKEKWLKPETKNNFWDYLKDKEPLPDSMKTHPDCKARIEKISKDHLINGDIPSNIIQLDLENIEMELLNILIEDEDYAGALYTALKLSDKYPDNSFVKFVIAECLFHFSWAIKNRAFTDYVGFPNEEYPAGINQIFIFLNNCNSTVFNNLLDNYYKNYLESKSGEYFDYITSLRKFALEPATIINDSILEYQKKYGSNVYYKRFVNYKTIIKKKK